MYYDALCFLPVAHVNTLLIISTEDALCSHSRLSFKMRRQFYYRIDTACDAAESNTEDRKRTKVLVLDRQAPARDSAHHPHAAQWTKPGCFSHIAAKCCIGSVCTEVNKTSLYQGWILFIPAWQWMPSFPHLRVKTLYADDLAVHFIAVCRVSNLADLPRLTSIFRCPDFQIVETNMGSTLTFQKWQWSSFMFPQASQGVATLDTTYSKKDSPTDTTSRMQRGNVCLKQSNFAQHILKRDPSSAILVDPNLHQHSGNTRPTLSLPDLL